MSTEWVWLPMHQAGCTEIFLLFFTSVFIYASAFTMKKTLGYCLMRRPVA